MQIDYIIAGGGGHALSIADALLSGGTKPLGYIAPTDQEDLIPGVGWLGSDDTLSSLVPQTIRLLNGVGSAGVAMDARRNVYLNLKARNFNFARLIHPSAVVSRLETQFGEGLQVLGGAQVVAGARLGDNVLINTRAVVEHHCVIGDHCHIATGAVICGGVEIGDSVHIGAGATLKQGVTIGDGAVIAAGAVVIENVEPLTLVAGVPGKVKRRLAI